VSCPHHGAVHHRHTLRWERWDYRDLGVYFVTITTVARVPLFGVMVDGTVRLSRFGEIARDEWLRAGALRSGAELDLFVVMPNHLHGLVTLLPDEPLTDLPRGAPRLAARSLGAFVGGFKSAASRRINDVRRTPGRQVWQRNYYDRIIRSEDELDQVRAYIHENPERWPQDPENPACQTEGEASLAPTARTIRSARQRARHASPLRAADDVSLHAFDGRPDGRLQG
jgi:REP element-mobilizing transposase RayT